MSVAFEGLTVEALEHLADALASGRLRTFEPGRLREFVPAPDLGAVSHALREATNDGAMTRHIAWTLRLLARERRARRAARDDIELVWTGPEEGGTTSRDTRIVARELFERAEHTLLISSYLTTDWGAVFGGLARRMEALPDLHVRMYVNIKPPRGSATPEEAVADFARSFRAGWPGARRPEVFFDPRTVRRDGPGQPSLHAKCVVADGLRVFVTSANFTEAAQVRNIEAGVVLTDATLAGALAQQFENLIAAGVLHALHGVA